MDSLPHRDHVSATTRRHRRRRFPWLEILGFKDKRAQIVKWRLRGLSAIGLIGLGTVLLSGCYNPSYAISDEFHSKCPSSMTNMVPSDLQHHVPANHKRALLSVIIFHEKSGEGEGGGHSSLWEDPLVGRYHRKVPSVTLHTIWRFRLS